MHQKQPPAKTATASSACAKAGAPARARTAKRKVSSFCFTPGISFGMPPNWIMSDFKPKGAGWRFTSSREFLAWTGRLSPFSINPCSLLWEERTMSLMAEAGGTAHAEGGAPVIVRVRADQPWRWLEAGWADMRAVPAISLAYGSTFLFVSILLAGLLFLGGASALLPVFGAGFLLVGPMLAVGLYEVSRRLEAGERVRLKDVIFVSSRNLTQLALVGGMLAGAFIIWLQIAGWIFAIFYGAVGIPPLSEFAP